MFSKCLNRYYVSLITIAILFLILVGFALWSGAILSGDASTAIDNLATDTYLELDSTRSMIIARMGKVKLRDYPYQVTRDTEKNLSDIVFPAGTMQVSSVMLLSAEEVLSKTELEVIGEETLLNPKAIQRYVPGVMVLILSDGNLIVIETDCTEPIQYRIEQVKAFVVTLWSALLGKETFRIRMRTDDAMSLMGIARNNPLLIMK